MTQLFRGLAIALNIGLLAFVLWALSESLPRGNDVWFMVLFLATAFCNLIVIFLASKRAQTVLGQSLVGLYFERLRMEQIARIAELKNR